MARRIIMPGGNAPKGPKTTEDETLSHGQKAVGKAVRRAIRASDKEAEHEAFEQHKAEVKEQKRARREKSLKAQARKKGITVEEVVELQKPKKLKGLKKGKKKTAGGKSLHSARYARPKHHRSRKKPAKSAPIPEGAMRIQKYLSEVGVASRRGAEELIALGEVSVNGAPVASLPCFVNPETDAIRVSGRVIKQKKAKLVYYLLNKPKGVVCTSNDEFGRPTVVNMVKYVEPRRIYCVGRLDVDSTGVLLLTNDGELTQKLTHPSFGAAKTYVVTVQGVVEAPAIEKLKKGIYLDGRRTSRAGLKVLNRSKAITTLEITLTEGRNREIRRMVERVGHTVLKLKRVAIGPITDRGLGSGSFRELSRREINQLRKLTEEDAKPQGSKE
ncbi:MAG: rRNA pseudouridine synthase [Phycisphaerales bacterium]|jgi:23S rRNA pseudouridine2605 synthase|nr:rRNA pseudouridine synthase [Phycisphaerales bacterium]